MTNIDSERPVGWPTAGLGGKCGAQGPTSTLCCARLRLGRCTITEAERQQVVEAIERTSVRMGDLKVGPGFQDVLMLRARPWRSQAVGRMTTRAREHTGWRPDARAG